VEQDLRVVNKYCPLERTRPVLDGKQKYTTNVSDLKKAQREKWTAHTSKNPFFSLKLKQMYNRSTEVTVLPPSFN
jgi:hypothetical protein